MKNYTIEKVFTNHDYEPYAIKRDLEIKEVVSTSKIDFQTYKDQVIFEKKRNNKKRWKSLCGVYTLFEEMVGEI